MSSGRGRALAAIAVLSVALGACGDSDDGGNTDTPPAAETAEELPTLPRGWSEHANQAGGFAFGLPRGWRAEDEGTATLVRSFDRLAAISISPDRTGEALALDLGEFATRAATALPGYEEPLDPSKPHRYEHQYEGASVEARGTSARSGVDQRIEVIVLRRAQIAAFTVVLAAGERARADRALAVARRVVATLRSRPVAAGAG